MKTKNLILAMFALVSFGLFAQDRTTVTATSNDISENLDLRAVASIFGESRDLEDFERRLNDPRTQISNLDLNQDYQVDYLRVIETVDGPTHLIVIQSVLGRDLFQDVATIEVERDRNNVVQVQVVGDVYMYGPDYIYEPVYVTRPVIFANFWVGNYRPYCSSWYWGYYPTYFVAWRPMPVFRYVNHIHVHINHHHHYNYVNVRRSHRAVAMHNRYRTNAYEVRHPDRSFAVRNNNVRNAYELQNTRTSQTGGVRTANVRAADNTVRSGGTRAVQTGGVKNATTRKNENAASGNIRGGSTTNGGAIGGVRTTTRTTRGNTDSNGNASTGGVRPSGATRSESASTGAVRSNGNTRYESSSTGGTRSTSGTVRSQSPSRSESGSVRSQSSTGGVRQASAPSRQFEQRSQPSVRQSAPRSNDRGFAQQRSSGQRESAPRGGQSGGGRGESGRR